MEWELEGGILGEVIWTQSFSPTDCDFFWNGVTNSYSKPADIAVNHPG